MLSVLCSPKRRFWKAENQHFRMRSPESTFQGCEYRIWSTNVEKCHGLSMRRGPPPICRKACIWLLTKTFSLPNDDFGRSNEMFDESFQRTFQRFVAQVLYSNPCKVFRRDSSSGSFDRPNSSFGEMKFDESNHIRPYG